MVKLEQGRYVIGFDNGYQFGKTVQHVFENGVHMLGTVEPSVKEHSLKYHRKYYKVGEGRAAITEDKVSDETARLLTMAAIAMELRSEGVQKAEGSLQVQYGKQIPGEEIWKVILKKENLLSKAYLTVQRQLGRCFHSEGEKAAPKTVTKQEIGLKTVSSYRVLPIPNYVFAAILEERKKYEKNRSRRKKEFQDLDYICCSSYGRPRNVYGDNRALVADCIPELTAFIKEVLPKREEREQNRKWIEKPTVL